MRDVDLLVDGEVTVVRAALDVNRGIDHLLSADEHIRARRFHRAIHQHRFVQARGVLRTLLGDRLDQDPASVVITVAEGGKPRLATPGLVSFNISHSDDTALFAFTSRGEVGVDIERVRFLDPVRLSATCFSAAEREDLLSVGRAQQLAAFFDGWVRKEAVIKADGRGVSLGLQGFTVSLQGPARLVEAPSGDGAGRWTMATLDAGPAVRAALAVRC